MLQCVYQGISGVSKDIRVNISLGEKYDENDNFHGKETAVSNRNNKIDMKYTVQ